MTSARCGTGWRTDEPSPVAPGDRRSAHMGDCQAHAAMDGESAVAKLIFGTRNIAPHPEAHTLEGWTWQQSRLNGRGVVPVPTATEAVGTACSERRVGHAGPAPALVDDPVFGLYAYDGTPGICPTASRSDPVTVSTSGSSTQPTVVNSSTAGQGDNRTNIGTCST